MHYLLSGLVAAATALMIYALINVWDQATRRILADQFANAQSLSMDGKRAQTYLRLWGFGLVAMVVVGGLLGVLPIAITLAVIMLFAPRWAFSYAIHKRRELLRDQMVGCTQALANSARAGQSLAQGLASVCESSPQPLATELRQIIAEYDHGRPLPETLNEAKDRLRIDSFSMFVSAIVVSLERGGKITQALERISHSLRENQRVEQKLQAETAGGWRVVLILTIFPFLFLGGFWVIYPEGTTMMLSTLLGQFLTIMIVLLVAASVWWSRQILKMDHV